MNLQEIINRLATIRETAFEAGLKCDDGDRAYHQINELHNELVQELAEHDVMKGVQPYPFELYPSEAQALVDMVEQLFMERSSLGQEENPEEELLKAGELVVQQIKEHLHKLRNA